MQLSEHIPCFSRMENTRKAAAMTQNFSVITSSSAQTCRSLHYNTCVSLFFIPILPGLQVHLVLPTNIVNEARVCCFDHSFLKDLPFCKDFFCFPRLYLCIICITAWSEAGGSSVSFIHEMFRWSIEEECSHRLPPWNVLSLEKVCYVIGWAPNRHGPARRSLG